MESAGEAIERLATAHGISLAELSRLIGRNLAYLQQFIRRGTPRALAERDRQQLARFFGVDEAMLGGAPSTEIAVPYLTVEASAGPGAASAAERVIRHQFFARAMLREAGVSPETASLIDVRGDSMAPGICAGDRLLVDRADRRLPSAGAIVVLRREDDLLVKRARTVAGGVELRSDNPAYPTIVCPRREIEVIGRAKLLLREPS